MFNLHCSMTENDYYNFNLVFQKLPSNRKNMLRGMIIVPAAWFLVYMLYGFVANKGFDLVYSTIGCIIFLIVSVIWILLYKPLIRLTLKSNIKKMKNWADFRIILKVIPCLKTKASPSKAQDISAK